MGKVCCVNRGIGAVMSDRHFDNQLATDQEQSITTTEITAAVPLMVAAVEQAVHADSSCYTGEAGIAIMYLRVASAALSAIPAAEAIRQARAHLDRAAQHGFHRSRFATLLEGTAGYHAVQCVVAHAQGDEASVVTALGAVQKISKD